MGSVNGIRRPSTGTKRWGPLLVVVTSVFLNGAMGACQLCRYFFTVSCLPAFNYESVPMHFTNTKQSEECVKYNKWTQDRIYKHTFLVLLGENENTQAAVPARGSWRLVWDCQDLSGRWVESIWFYLVFKQLRSLVLELHPNQCVMFF